MSVHWVLTTVPTTARTHTARTPAAAGLGIIWMMMVSLAMVSTAVLVWQEGSIMLAPQF